MAFRFGIDILIFFFKSFFMIWEIKFQFPQIAQIPQIL